MEGVAAYSSPRPVVSSRAGAALAAVLVALGAFAVAVAAVLVVVAAVAVVSGHAGVSVGTQAVPATAGFACADAAAAMLLWRRGRLHPLAVAAVWASALLVAVPGAGAAAGAVAAVACAAVAVFVGGGEPPAWRSRRLLVGLGIGACVLPAVAAAHARPVHADRSLVVAPAQSRAAAAVGAARVHAARGPTAPIRPAGGRTAPIRPAAAATGPPAAASPAPAAEAPSVVVSPAHAPAPAAAAAPSARDVAAATTLVRDYYAALDAHRFAAVWVSLPRAQQSRFGGFAVWRAGYRTTLSSRSRAIRVTATAGGGLLVRHVLVATDRYRCGTQTRRFAVRWRLARNRASWGVVSLAATALGPARTPCL